MSGFLLPSYSNFVLLDAPFLRYLTSKMPWPWKSG